eukprot:COSAG02_NODE_15860_length_1135_cov_1.535714_2_plen_328_part_01
MLSRWWCAVSGIAQRFGVLWVVVCRRLHLAVHRASVAEFFRVCVRACVCVCVACVMPPKRRPGGRTVLANSSNQLPTVNGWKKGASAQTRTGSTTSAVSSSSAANGSIGSSIPLVQPPQYAAGSLEPSVLVASPAASPQSISLVDTSEALSASFSLAAQDIDSMLADLAEDAVAMSAVEAYWEQQRKTLDGSLDTSSNLPDDVSVSVTKMTRLLEETDAWLSQSASLAPGSPRVATTVSHSSSQLSTGNDPEPELPQDCTVPQHSPSIRRRRLLSMRTSSVEQFFINDTPTRTTSTTITHGAMTPTDVDVVLAPSPATSIVASDALVS